MNKTLVAVVAVVLAGVAIWWAQNRQDGSGSGEPIVQVIVPSSLSSMADWYSKSAISDSASRCPESLLKHQASKRPMFLTAKALDRNHQLLLWLPHFPLLPPQTVESGLPYLVPRGRKVFK